MTPTQPHSLEAEQAILGTLLRTSKGWPDVVASLRPEDFWRDAHRWTFDAMVRVVARGLDLDMIPLREELQRMGRLDEVGVAYLMGLTDVVPVTEHLPVYCDIVREKSRLRALVRTCDRTAMLAYGGEPSADVIEQGVAELLALASVGAGDPQDIGAVVAEQIESMNTAAPPLVIPTGLADIDRMLGGLKSEELMIVAARPSVGKSSFALGIAKAAAEAGFPVAHFPLEENKRAVAKHVLAWQARVTTARMDARMLSESDRLRISQARETLQSVPLLIQDAASTLAQISAWCHRFAQSERGLGVVVIDYLQLLAESSDNRTGEVAAISRGLKHLAKRYHVPVIALSQLSRSPETRKDKRPQLSDLRESGALEQDADVAILLFREEMHKPTDENRGIAEAIIAKHRDGPTGVVKLYFAEEYAWFTNLQPESV